MKTLPDTHVREASRCPSPVTIWQILLSRLLDQHYGLTLNDTPFADERVQALNMGRIVVDVDGVNLAELINVACDNGYSLRIVDESDRTSAERTPPFAALTGIRCSTAHITAKDNAWLYSLSHQTNDTGESEWIHFTGSGYLLRTDAWSYPLLRLKRLGLSKTFRRLVVTLTRRYGVSLIHLDASAECLPDLPTFDW